MEPVSNVFFKDSISAEPGTFLFTYVAVSSEVRHFLSYKCLMSKILLDARTQLPNLFLSSPLDQFYFLNLFNWLYKGFLLF